MQCMPWSAMDDVLFEAHLHSRLGDIARALSVAGYDSLVVHAGHERMLFQDDQPYPYRPSPWFSWLVPAAPAPGSILCIRPGSTPVLLFVAPDDYWHSPPEVPGEPWTGQFQLRAVATGKAALEAAREYGQGHVAWLGESAPPQAGWEANPPALLWQLEQLRCHKTAHELACMREASRRGVAGHMAAERAFRDGASEFDIHLAYLAAVRQTDAELPYPNIIALNEHAATLHYQLRDRRAPARPLSLLIDAGASCRGYASDITRTWARAPGLFASLIEGMHDLQQQLCEAVAPGVDWRDLHLRAHRLVAQLLREAEVLRMSAEDAVATGTSSAFLPHGLGHLLGLQVHDVAGFRPTPDAEPIPRPDGHPALRLTRPLEAGMVVTVEPGVYFIDSLLARLKAGPHAGAVDWTVVENLAPFGGIRIEDNVVVTASGHENLTRTAFADVA